MKIQTTIKHEIKFTVEAFWDEEGGMGHDQFGNPVDTLNEAVTLFDLAKTAKPEENWKIVGIVTKIIT